MASEPTSGVEAPGSPRGGRGGGKSSGCRAVSAEGEGTENSFLAEGSGWVAGAAVRGCQLRSLPSPFQLPGDIMKLQRQGEEAQAWGPLWGAGEGSRGGR